MSSLYLIAAEAIFPQEDARLFGAGLIRVKGFCLLLLNILKYYSIYWVIYMLMQGLPLHRPFDSAARCLSVNVPIQSRLNSKINRGEKGEMIMEDGCRGCERR